MCGAWQLRFDWGQPTTRVCLCFSMGSHQGLFLNKHHAALYVVRFKAQWHPPSTARASRWSIVHPCQPWPQRGSRCVQTKPSQSKAKPSVVASKPPHKHPHVKVANASHNTSPIKPEHPVLQPACQYNHQSSLPIGVVHGMAIERPPLVTQLWPPVY